MTIDELILCCKRTVNFKLKYWDGEKRASKDYDYLVAKITLETLKANKQGYKLYKYDYSERDFVEAETELSEILKVLTDDRH